MRYPGSWLTLDSVRRFSSLGKEVLDSNLPADFTLLGQRDFDPNLTSSRRGEI
jgi:hypothetical protein